MFMKLNDIQRNYINEKLINLKKSKFRNSFHLRKYMYEYIDEVGFEKLEEREYLREMKYVYIGPSYARKELPKWTTNRVEEDFIFNAVVLEEDELNYTCEKFVDTCNNFKLHFLSKHLFLLFLLAVVLLYKTLA